MSALENLSTLLVQVQSGDNAVRMPAETALYTDWLDAGGNRPAELLTGLAQLATSGDPTQRSSAAVILRRCSTRVANDSPQLLRVVDQIAPEARSQVRELVLQGMLAPDQQAFTRHKLADAVAELARPSSVDPAGTAWPGLLETIAQAVGSSDNAAIREAAFRVLGAAPELLENREDLIGGVIQLVMQGFEDPSESVRTSATSAFASFFSFLPKSTWGLFKPLLPALLNVMEPLRQNQNESELTSVLESLITLAEIAPRMFKPVFSTLIDFSLSVASDRELEEPVRMSAMELMAAFADESPNMCRQEPKYAAQMVPALLKMLTEVGADDDDGADWNNTDDSEQIEEDEAMHSEAKLVTDRLSLSLGGEVIVPPLFEYLPQLMQSTEWRERFAALMALSNAAEGCRDVMIESLDRILEAVVPLLADVHSRVQWGACNALGQLSTDFSPEIQEQFGSKILPALIGKLGSDSTFKVQAHAAAALVNFSDAAEKETMDPYLDDLLTRLVGLVQSPKRYVQEQALTTIAMVADSAEQLFTKYYDTLMPLVMNIMTTEVPPEYRLLKAKAIECSTLIALAVGREKFLPQMQQLGAILMQIQQQNPDGVIQTEQGEEEDPCHAFLMQSWGRLCRVIGHDFVPYLPVVMPQLLAAAKSQVECHILDVDQAESLRDAEGWEVVKYSGQWLGIHTAAFEEKAGAIELLHVYPRELGADFWPYVPEILQDVVQPGIKFYYNLRVRTYSCQLVPHLVACAQAHFNGAKDSADVLGLWQPLLHTLVTGVLRNDRESAGMTAEVLLTIYRCVELIGPAALSAQDLTTVSTCFVEILTQLKQRLDARAAEGRTTSRRNEDEWDEYEEQDVEEDEEEREDEELVDAAVRFVHTLFRTYGAEALSGLFSQLVQAMTQFATSPAQDAQIFALGLLAEVVEFGKEAGAAAVQNLGPFVLSTLSSAPVVRASATRAVSRIAQFGTPAVTPFVLQTLEPMLTAASQSNARDSANIAATERACSAIARVLRSHAVSGLAPDQMSIAVAAWLKTMPITHETEDVVFPYMFLSELIEKKHPVVVENVGVTFYAIVAALSAHTLSGAPAERVVSLVKPLLTTLSSDKQMELFNTLTDSQKQVAQTVFA